MPPSVDKMLRIAHRQISVGDFGRAEEICRDVLSRFPKNKKARQLYQKLKTPPQAIIDKLIGLYNTGRLKETIKFGQALAIKFPNSPILYEILGAANLGLENTSETIAAYSKLLQLSPKHTDALNNLGMVFYKQGDFARSVENYEKAVELEPGFADAHYNLANAFKQTGKLRKATKFEGTTLERVPT